VYTYYGNGNLQSIAVTGIDAAISTTAPQTRTLSYTYGSSGIYPYQITNAVGTTTLYYDSALGVLISAVDPNGVGVDFPYDGFGRRNGVFPDNGQAALS